ncbi:endonuclease/exonuclease/phosphatase family protein [Streptomyces coeruleoprunus]|uniref:Endonuclease/exonuclease/phosphatase family protein n=1 Tax=Streptomyces coeruleoprunus TaxID=285563 RepID=A0ABV9X8X0_9ACTN
MQPLRPIRRALGCAAALTATLAAALLGPAPAASGEQPASAASAGRSVPSAVVSDDVRVLAWNIYHGGRNVDLGGAENLPRVVDQVVAIAPDVFFSVETYGAAEALRDGLTRRAGKGTYSATRITAGASDNLWIFTRYPVTQVYPTPTGTTVTDFHFGGVRVRLPSGREVNLFDTWLGYTEPWIGDLIDENAAAVRDGGRPRHSASRVQRAESGAQVPQITDIVGTQLPAALAGNTDPVILAGDLNTVPAADWSRAWAGCPDHFGLGYDLRATRVLTDAGFTDTYRAAHPDVCAAPGRTWSPLPAYDYMITPDRIDFVFARGAGVSVTGSHTVDTRLPEHPPGPFYSDHAAVVTDLRIGT